MTFQIGCAPCSWGVDDVRNPHLPPWTRVLDEAAEAGYRGIELGPYGYMPLDAAHLGAELQRRSLHLVAGTIFDNLVAEENLPALLRQADEICTLLKALPQPAGESSSDAHSIDGPATVQPGHRLQPAGQRPSPPYLVLIDWGHPARDLAAGRSDAAPRLNDADWARMVSHIRQIADFARERHGIRSVIHPHAGGCIEFADEIRRIAADIPHDTAGLCLDTGHLAYSGMDPAGWLREFAHRLDYVHFKDVDAARHAEVLSGKPMPFFEACARGVMTPIGSGSLDYPAIRATLLDIGYAGAITLEQERDPRNAGTSLRDVQISRDYLRDIGFQ